MLLRCIVKNRFEYIYIEILVAAKHDYYCPHEELTVTCLDESSVRWYYCCYFQ
jgi:hypothetical protein